MSSEVPTLQRVGRWVGILLMLVVGWLYLVSGLVAPLWAVVSLLAVWAAVFSVAMRAWNSKPWLILAAPFLLFLFWAVAIWAGGQFLGWTA